MPQVGLVLDYDHSSDLAAPEGRPAPAAGWLKQFKVEHGAIFARIEWTADAAEAVKAKKYRYVSPVFEHNKEGKVERILRAALTNNPALINLPAIAAANNGVARMAKEGDGKETLSDIVKRFEAAMPGAEHHQIMKHVLMEMAPGKSFKDWADEEAEEPEHEADGGEDEEAAADPYEKETEAQMTARQSEEMKSCMSDEEREKMTAKHAAEKERFTKRVAGLEHKAKPGGGPGQDSQGTEAMTSKDIDKAVAKHPMMVKMAEDLNRMREEQAKTEATATVDKAIREGRLIPSQRDWAIEYCTSEPKGFEKFIGAAPKILQNGADGTFTGRIGEAKDEQISQNEVEICQNLGLPSLLKDKDGKSVFIERFVAAKQARLSRNATLLDND
jgi:phage I-like protein